MNASGEGAATASTPGIEGLDGFEPIDQGGSGIVYKARQAKLNRDVAVKVVTVAGVDERAQRRFQREQASMGSLSSHPSVVDLFDSGITDGGFPYLVMEYLPAGSLEDRIRAEGPLPWPDACSDVVQVARAVDAAHEQGVLHRDIKPANIMMSEFGRAKLTDFGIASIMETTATMTSSVTATVEHAAPEILNGGDPTRASDVYSLGSTLFALLAGISPFRHTTDEPMLPILTRVATDPVPDLRARGVPAAICDVIERATAKDPAQRHASAADFAAALEAAADVSADEPTEPIPVVPASDPTPPAAGVAAAASGLAASHTTTSKLPAGSVAPTDDTATRIVRPGDRPPEPPAPTGSQPVRSVTERMEPDSPGAPPTSRREQRARTQRRRRILLALVGLLVLGGGAVITAVVLSSGGDSGPDAVEVPADSERDTDPQESEERTETEQAESPPEYEEIDVPSVTGMPERGAVSELESAGFAVDVELTDVGCGSDDDGSVVDQGPVGGSLEPGSTVNIAVGREVCGEIPEVVGRSEASATRTLEGAGFDTRVSYTDVACGSDEIGEVVDQDPAGGTSTDEGERVEITIGRESGCPTQVSVPRVVGRSEGSARSALENAGLNVNVQYVDASSCGPSEGDQVTAQNPSSGDVDAGSTVTISVTVAFDCPAMAPMPPVVGEHLEVAAPTLENLGLVPDVRPGPTTCDASKLGRVAEQSVTAGVELEVGTTVVIELWTEGDCARPSASFGSFDIQWARNLDMEFIYDIDVFDTEAGVDVFFWVEDSSGVLTDQSALIERNGGWEHTFIVSPGLDPGVYTAFLAAYDVATGEELDLVSYQFEV